jgi:hypothetical protein
MTDNRQAPWGVRLPADLQDKFLARIEANSMTKSQGMIAAIEQWLGIESNDIRAVTKSMVWSMVREVVKDYLDPESEEIFDPEETKSQLHDLGRFVEMHDSVHPEAAELDRLFSAEPEPRKRPKPTKSVAPRKARFKPE